MLELQPLWTLLGLGPGFGIGAGLAFALATLVYRSRPDRPQNRWLALLLLIEAMSSFAWFVLNVFHAPDIARGAYLAGHASLVTTAAVYPLFLGTLDTPLAAPMRDRRVLGVIWTTTAMTVALLIVRTEWFLIGPVEVHGAFTMLYGAGARLIYTVLFIPLITYALFAFVSMWRRAPRGSQTRQQTRIFTIAFGLRDGLLFMNLLGFALLPLVLPAESFVTRRALVAMVALYHVQIITFPLLTGYGILKHQLFDIDLKIKWTINRGTLAGIFLGVFFIISVVAENYLTTRYGWAIGGIGAGLLLFALAPLQRIADRVADAAMPRVRDDEEYRTVRKKEVYLAAVESALRDGLITDAERDVLATLQQQLGIAAPDALTIERTVRGGGA